MNPIQEILAGNIPGQKGVFSVCTASPLVLQAAVRHAKRHDYVVVVEATANQVNQFGGYTGMLPADYAALVGGIVAREGLSPDRVILGGDHLGPLTWQALPEDEAMARSEKLVTDFTLAGFTKIHLDTSMRVATDDPTAPLDVAVCARRCAKLATCVQTAYEAVKAKNPNAARPVLVIGSEVPIPGGSQEHEDSITPTDPAEFRRQFETFRQAFEAAGASFADVVAFVVQPGVEFGDDFVFQYDRDRAAKLTGALAEFRPLVFEGHSTDYQTVPSLSRMVDDGIRILKVGPALTFGLREALFLAEHLEAVLVPNPADRSGIQAAILREMDADDKYWKKYYAGTEAEIAYKKLYSFSDRCRYYLPGAGVEQAISKLLSNLSQVPIALVCQYFPRQYARIMEGNLAATGLDVILDRVGDWCADYAAACGVQL